MRSLGIIDKSRVIIRTEFITTFPGENETRTTRDILLSPGHWKLQTIHLAPGHHELYPGNILHQRNSRSHLRFRIPGGFRYIPGNFCTEIDSKFPGEND